MLVLVPKLDDGEDGEHGAGSDGVLQMPLLWCEGGGVVTVEWGGFTEEGGRLDRNEVLS